MRLKAQRMVDEEPVCQRALDEKEGTMRVKPTTFNAAVNVKASILCPTCDCEKVGTQINTEAHKDSRWSHFLTLLYHRFITVSLLSVLQTPILKADRCHGNGDLVCGKCQCYDGW